MNHFVLQPPTAEAAFPTEITPQEIVALQAARIRELEAESQARTIAASTIANVACCLFSILGKGEVVIPRQVADRLRGAQLTVEEVGEDVVVRVREKEKPAPLAWENSRAD